MQTLVLFAILAFSAFGEELIRERVLVAPITEVLLDSLTNQDIPAGHAAYTVTRIFARPEGEVAFLGQRMYEELDFDWWRLHYRDQVLLHGDSARIVTAPDGRWVYHWRQSNGTLVSKIGPRGNPLVFPTAAGEIEVIDVTIAMRSETKATYLFLRTGANLTEKAACSFALGKFGPSVVAIGRSPWFQLHFGFSRFFPFTGNPIPAKRAELRHARTVLCGITDPIGD